MDTKKEFSRLMGSQKEIALATSVQDRPNVRIVNFYYVEEERTLYFSSFRKNRKTDEFSRNSQVAFTTIPHEGNEHVRAQGTVRKSDKSIYDMRTEFSGKLDGYGELIEQAGEFLDLYEIVVDDATVILDFDQIESIKLTCCAM